MLKTIPKGSKTNSPNSMRFISLSNMEIKLFDKLVTGLLREHIAENGLQNPNQYGELKGRNCLGALTKLILTTTDMLHELPKNTVYVIALDLKNYFDSVNSLKFTKKLYEIGIKDKLLYQILTNREVMVQIDGCTSRPKKVRNGLGQRAPSSVVLADIYSSSIGPKDSKTRIKVFC